MCCMPCRLAMVDGQGEARRERTPGQGGSESWKDVQEEMEERPATRFAHALGGASLSRQGSCMCLRAYRAVGTTRRLLGQRSDDPIAAAAVAATRSSWRHAPNLVGRALTSLTDVPSLYACSSSLYSSTSSPWRTIRESSSTFTCRESVSLGASCKAFDRQNPPKLILRPSLSVLQALPPTASSRARTTLASSSPLPPSTRTAA